MGNCCKPASSSSSSSMEWGGENWEDCLKSENNNNTIIKRSWRKVFDESEGLSLGKVKKENLSEALRASCDVNGMVKVKISKKELAELLGGIEKQNEMKKKKKKEVGRSTTSAEQVLQRLIKGREQANQHHDSGRKPWRPLLQTIKEVN
ncbi:hypothetical protein Lal_00006647 [Lupinus albus]|uniref:Uncharacterized protein n=1 Tax=Lupinus albus TaxID=3870 RepID=A0A6A4Q870_LUPAL|nr:hypothetical protein Lalb_Chr07g0177261 [Lupinus albus]KAF1876016.1 hypothetical protein Lal_00006647 [Lupinus albus]